MKTQIITLESHDDLISVRDRMSWAKTPRILLVWPKYEKISLRQVDLKVLQRHASSLGAQVGLVTRQRRVRAEAEALGIPVFTSTGDAQRMTWPKAKQKKWPHKIPDKTLREKREQVQVQEAAWRSSPVTRIGLFIVGVLAVLAVAALFIPSAEVRLKPAVQIQSLELPVTASSSVNDVFITGSIPAYEKRVIVDGLKRLLVTGEGSVPQSKAKGVVLFQNITESPVTVPLGTIVLGNDIRFATTESGMVEAGVGETLELPIEAVAGGLAGNLPAETIDAVEGKLSLSLSATNPEPTFGGAELASVQATDEDRELAKKLLSKDLEDSARTKLLDEMNAGDILFDDTIAVTQVLSEVYDPPPGTPGSQLTLNMQEEFSALYADASDLTKLASLALNASLPAGFAPASGEMTVESVSTPELLDDGSFRWMIRAERDVVPQVDTALVTQLISGMLKSTAQARLDENLPLISESEIVLTPSWWPWVPIVPFRIEVVTE